MENEKTDFKYSTVSNLNSEIGNQSFSSKEMKISSNISVENKSNSISTNLYTQFRNLHESFPNFDYEYSDEDFTAENDSFHLEKLDDINLKEKDFFLDLEQEEEKEELISNTRLDSYLDEIVELVLKDFVMSWLNNFVWEKESGKITSLTR